MSLATVRSNLEPHLHQLLAHAKARPLLTTAIAGATTATLIAAIQDYRAFLALGRGGLPYNVFGWLVNTLLLRPLALSKSARLSVDDYPSTGASAYVRELLPRQGPRADTGGIVPHRQLSQVAPASMAGPLNEMLRSFVSADPEGRLEIKKSHYELHNDALYVAQRLLDDPEKASKLPHTARIAKGEAAHVHPDRSVHLYLHPADARVVIEKGWGERHRLSRTWPWWLGGGQGKLGLGYTWIMVYGARNQEEVEVTRRLIGEGVKFMLGEREA